MSELVQARLVVIYKFVQELLLAQALQDQVMSILSAAVLVLLQRAAKSVSLVARVAQRPLAVSQCRADNQALAVLAAQQT